MYIRLRFGIKWTTLHNYAVKYVKSQVGSMKEMGSVPEFQNLIQNVHIGKLLTSIKYTYI